MYAINHTTQTIFSLSEEGERKVRARAAVCRKKAKSVFYRTVLKADVVSFVEDYAEAKAIQAMLFLHGAQS